jgi:hypothetical protein
MLPAQTPGHWYFIPVALQKCQMVELKALTHGAHVIAFFKHDDKAHRFVLICLGVQ